MDNFNIESKNYWSGEVALICSYCPGYRSFPSVEQLKEHIRKEHPAEMCVSAIEDNGIKVIIIDVAMPHISTKQQFETVFNCIKNHQKQILARFGWLSLAGTFLCKGLIETYEPINKQGRDFIRYTAIKR